MTPEMEKSLHKVGEAWKILYDACQETVREEFKGEGWPDVLSALGACIGKNIACFPDAERRSQVFWAIALEMAMWEAEFRGVRPALWDSHTTPHAVAQYLMSHWVNAVSFLPDPKCRNEEIELLSKSLEIGLRIRAEDAARLGKLN